MAIGRVIVGMVAGIGSGIVPIYFSEISPTRVRGAVSTVHQLGITLGILLSQLLSTPSLHLLGSKTLWRWLFAGIHLSVPDCVDKGSYSSHTY